MRIRQFGCGFLPDVRMRSMKRSVVMFLSFCLIAGSLSANLGDNSERIEDAYGTIAQRRLQDDGTVRVVYAKGRYLYMVTFANSRSISESYSRANGKDLSEKEIAKFLKANSEALATSRLIVVTWPARTGIPSTMAVVEFATPEEAKKFTPKLETFLPIVIPPTMTPSDEPQEQPKPSPAAQPDDKKTNTAQPRPSPTVTAGMRCGQRC